MTLSELQRKLADGTLSVRELINMTPAARASLLSQLQLRQAKAIQAALDRFIDWETK